MASSRINIGVFTVILFTLDRWGLDFMYRALTNQNSPLPGKGEGICQAVGEGNIAVTGMIKHSF
jgi:hypothetical protein